MSETDTATTGQAAPTRRSRFASVVTRLAREIDEGAEHPMPKGDLTALRRDGGARSPTFYKVAARLLSEVLDEYRSETALVAAERQWAMLVHLLACTGGQHRVGAASLGAVLAQAGLAEARFLRLLRAEGDSLDSASRAALAPLVQQALTFDPLDLAALVLTAAPNARTAASLHYEDRDSVRRRIARDFYRAEAKENSATDSK